MLLFETLWVFLRCVHRCLVTVQFSFVEYKVGEVFDGSLTDVFHEFFLLHLWVF